MKTVRSDRSEQFTCRQAYLVLKSIMFLTTLLSALPLLNPALPVQEPVTKTGQKCTCSTQEPGAKVTKTRTKTAKNARTNTTKTARKSNKTYGQTVVNRSVVTAQVNSTPHQEPVNKTKQRAQRALRRVTQRNTATTTTTNSKFDVSGLSKVNTSGSSATIRKPIVRVDVDKASSSVAALGSIDTGVPVDNSPMWNVDTSRGNRVQWGQHDESLVSGLENANNAKTKKNTKKAASKKNTKKQVRKNRKR